MGMPPGLSLSSFGKKPRLYLNVRSIRGSSCPANNVTPRSIGFIFWRIGTHVSFCCFVTDIAWLHGPIMNQIGVDKHASSDGASVIFQAKPNRAGHCIRIRKIQAHQCRFYGYRWTISESELLFRSLVQVIINAGVDEHNDESQSTYGERSIVEPVSLFASGVCLVFIGWWLIFFNDGRSERVTFGMPLVLFGGFFIAVGFSMLAL